MDWSIYIMPVGNRYEVVLRSVQNNIEIFNRFYYEQTLGSGGAEELRFLMNAELIPPLKAITSDSLYFDYISVDNLDVSTDFAQFIVNDIGDVTGDVLPQYVGFNIMLLRGDKDWRPGRKNFAGVPESSQNNGILTTFAAAGVAVLALFLGGEVTDSTDTFKPILARRAPVTGAVTATTDIIGATVRGLGTQNTRKR